MKLNDEQLESLYDDIHNHYEIIKSDFGIESPTLNTEETSKLAHYFAQQLELRYHDLLHSTSAGSDCYVAAKAIIELLPGQHLYNYIVDGE